MHLILDRAVNVGQYRVSPLPFSIRAQAQWKLMTNDEADDVLVKMRLTASNPTVHEGRILTWICRRVVCRFAGHRTRCIQDIIATFVWCFR